MAFLAAIPISITKETCAKILFSKVGLKNLAAQRANKAPKIANGVPSKILNGKDQLSYCADKIKNTIVAIGLASIIETETVNKEQTKANVEQAKEDVEPTRILQGQIIVQEGQIIDNEAVRKVYLGENFRM